MNEFTFMSTKENLKETLAHITPNFSLLTSLLPSKVPASLSKADKDYCQDCFVIPNEVTVQHELNDPPKSIEQLMEQVVMCLIVMRKRYVQCLGQEYKGFTLRMRNLNYGRAIIEANPTFRNLFALMPYKQLFQILLNYTIIVPYKGEHVQVTGPILNQTYNMKAIGSKKKKYMHRKTYNTSDRSSQSNSTPHYSPPRLPSPPHQMTPSTMKSAKASDSTSLPSVPASDIKSETVSFSTPIPSVKAPNKKLVAASGTTPLHLVTPSGTQSVTGLSPTPFDSVTPSGNQSETGLSSNPLHSVTPSKTESVTASDQTPLQSATSQSTQSMIAKPVRVLGTARKEKKNEDIKGKDKEGIEGKDKEDLRVKDKEGIKGKDKEDTRGKDEEDLRVKRSEDTRGEEDLRVKQSEELKGKSKECIKERYSEGIKDAYHYSQQRIKRFQIFYCSSMNRASGLFKRNIFFDKGLTKGPFLDQCRLLVAHCITTHFTNKVRLNQNIQAIFEQHIFQLFERVRTLLEVRKFKGKDTSRFDILLSKHCQLGQKYHETKTNVLNFIEGKPSEEVGTLFNDLYGQYTPYQEVKGLIVQVLNITVPQQLLGAENMKVLGSMMKDFVSMKRFQNYRIQDFLARLDVFGMKWLPCNYNPKFRRAIITRRRKVLAMIVVFLINEIVVPVMKFNFYITEKHKEANKIFYYRKPVWTLVSKLAIKRFSQQNLEDFDQLKAFKMKKGALCPEGKLRLLPKNGTFRPILTFNRKIELNPQAKLTWRFKLTLNQYLSDTQLVLRNLKNILGNKFGYSVFDNRQIMKKYDTFVDKWRKMGSPPMKYFTLDIHKCYDSINTSLLLKFIEETPYIDDQYVIVKYNRLYRNKRPLFGHNSFTGYFNYRERMSANSMSDDMMQIKEELKVPSIHVFPAKQRLITKKDIINKLSKICEGSIVGYRKHYWLQKLGIPQGLNVSGVLCSLYFACLEDNFVKVKDGLLMRLTDDYLYIGPQAEAVKVLDNLLFCARKYNFRFSQDKISKNFDHPQLTKRSPSKQILWIGKRINIQTLQMSPNFQMSERVFYSMNVNLNRHNVKSFLKNKLKSLLTNHFASYFKPKLFPYEHVASNVRLYVEISLEKFYPFLKHVLNIRIPDVQVLILKLLKSCLHEFLLFACMLADSINDKLFYKKLYVEVTSEVAKFFKNKNHPEFRSIYKIFEADSQRQRDTLPPPP